MGNPSVPPAFQYGVSLWRWEERSVMAFQEALRPKKYAVPCGLLVPDFMVMSTIPPALWPNSASTEFCCTVYSVTASMGGVYPSLFPAISGVRSEEHTSEPQ